jgi:hypothetical protein
MTNTNTIPPEALEAAAEELFHIQYGEYHGSWADAPEWLKVTVRGEARAACLAMLREWPGMTTKRFGEHVALFNSDPAIILPLPKEPSDDK